MLYFFLITERKLIDDLKKKQTMSSDRDQNGPTQVLPPLQYTDLTSHIGIGAQINGTGMMGKSFGKFVYLKDPL